MNPILSLVLVMVMVLTAIAMVLTVGIPLIDTTVNTENVKQAENTLKFLDNYIQDVASEGKGAKRVLKFSSPGEFLVIPQEEAIQFEIDSGIEIFEYMSRKIVENLVYISGNDVDCYEGNNITMENSFLKVVFQKVNQTTPLSSINTENNILMLNEKTHNTLIYPENTSVIIDNDPSTAYGTGYSEILKSGYDMPVCYTHFFVNSSQKIYDIYYILYAGADFLVADIRNIN